MIQIKCLIPVAICGALAGCITLTPPEAKNAVAPLAPIMTPALQVISSAQPGAAETVDDPGLGGPVEVSVLHEYDAASGKRCKRVAIRGVQEQQHSTRVACNGTSGWYWTQASLT
ncbi:MAG: DVU3141 family protein [Alphaproteobacteria bacterium]